MTLLKARKVLLKSQLSAAMLSFHSGNVGELNPLNEAQVSLISEDVCMCILEVGIY